ncbi:MAG: hypothetical protein IPO58_21455 [Betaproteobacteria bacterium]|nr:hypothetical protein [Betaproteobacteria bacterium]
MADRGPGICDVVPQGARPHRPDLARPPGRTPRAIAQALLLAALALLWEIVALGRQRYRLSACAGADSN